MRIKFVLIIAALTATIIAGCGQQPSGAMPGMDHSGHTAANAPYDAAFIDGMIVHHQGAVTMAQQALTQSQRPELRTLAEEIVKAQQAEITQLQAWRKQWYPDLPTTDSSKMNMGPMDIANDTTIPFDRRFIDAMIPHHQAAVAMAEDAKKNATKPEIKQLADTIITTQNAEIAQMETWKKAWFSETY